MKFSNQIINWYLENKRNLPWRETTDPYFIWVSEIILQQTRVDQGLKYYKNFIARFPSLRLLAEAEEIEVLKVWQGLGYYSRARNMHFTAKYIFNDLKNHFPNTYEAILKLKGIGPYTAAAISSFAFDLPQAVVDGNVFRVLARYFNDSTPIDSTDGKKLFTQYAQMLLDEKKSADYNQAIMELGALVCKPVKPDCKNCPISESCQGLRKGTVDSLPFKQHKIKIKKRYFNYVFSKDSCFLKKRTTKDIWLNLYEFPMYEPERMVENKKLKSQIEKNFSVKIKNTPSYSTKYILTHQHIHVNFWEILDFSKLSLTNYISLEYHQINDFPVPQLIANFVVDNFMNIKQY